MNLVDLEGDGNPGITLQASILGLLNGEGYAVQRYRYRLDGTMFDADTIIGYIDWTSEQRMVAATHELFMARFEDSTDHVDAGGLAGAVRPEKPEDFAFADREGNIVNREQRSKAFTKSLDLDHPHLR